MRRIRRWAITPRSTLESRKGSTPSSTSRVTAPAALRVCTVEKTRCPVSAACTAIWAVSASRISPTMMMSGSWRRIVRSAVAKVTSICGFTCTWQKRGSTISIGSSTVVMLTSGPER